MPLATAGEDETGLAAANVQSSLAGGDIHGMDPTVAGSDVEDAIDDGWGRVDLALDLGPPRSTGSPSIPGPGMTPVRSGLPRYIGTSEVALVVGVATGGTMMRGSSWRSLASQMPAIEARMSRMMRPISNAGIALRRTQAVGCFGVAGRAGARGVDSAGAVAEVMVMGAIAFCRARSACRRRSS